MRRWPWLFVVVAPLLLGEYCCRMLNLICIAVVGALGLNILVGYTGQISIGHGAFMSVGAYTAANLAVRLGLPFWITLPAGGLMAALIGVVVGMPSLRIKGLYLAIATLAGQLIIEWTINHVPCDLRRRAGLDPGAEAGAVRLSPRAPSGSSISSCCSSPRSRWSATLNLVRSRIGRAFVAVRDQDIAAEIIGINIFRYKLLAFAISSFYAGVTGVLYTYYLGIANYEQFQIDVSIDYLAMIIIGGLGSVLGSIFGAVFVTLLPILIRMVHGERGRAVLRAGRARQRHPAPAARRVRRLAIILFLVVEPEGLNRLWRNVRNYFRFWPFSY